MAYISFEEVKEMFKKSIDETTNINDALEKTVQLIYSKGYEDGSKHLWISSTISPKVSGEYLVTFGGTYLTGIDYYTTESDAKKIFDEPEEYIGWRSQNVIAWMPLLKPYKEESGGSGMKIVIDIPKKAYENIKAEKEIDWLGVEYILDCIKSGTPIEEPIVRKKYSIVHSILEDIKEEINQIRILHNNSGIGYGLDIALGIINKYKVESEDKK